MKAKLTNIQWLTVLAFTSLSLSTSTAFAQGSLTPPGAPAPTMKTLNQIEPRLPVSSLPCAITNSGSYYVTANLTGVAGTNGISIAVGNVSLDLMGFTLTGVAGSQDGVSVLAKAVNVLIHNGNLQGWGGYGVNGMNANNSHLEQLRACSNSAGGLAIGNGSTIINSEVSLNGNPLSYTGNGIIVGNGSGVNGCYASLNISNGIVGGVGTIISGCSAITNGAWGVILGDYSTINGCSAIGNDQFSQILAGGIKTGNG